MHTRAEAGLAARGGVQRFILPAASILTRKSVRRGSFDTVRALVTHIRRYIGRWNDNPRPFVWTKQPVDLLDFDQIEP